MRILFAALLLASAIAAPGAWPVLAHEPAASATPLRELRLEGRFTQGGLVTAQAPAGARVQLDGRPVPVAANGLFLLGFGRDAGASAKLVVDYPDGLTETRRLAVAKRKYKVERIDGLPQTMVTPSAESLKRIRAEQVRINAARAQAIRTPHFAEGFAWPVRGRISGIYGSRRILNGKPRNPHPGVDIAAPEGTLVTAPADGVVTLTDDDMYFTGMTVILHHGLGLTSFLVHMSAILVSEGQVVKKGDAVGRVGQTGRATGPHLHWGMNWRDARLDPQLLVGPMGPMPKKSHPGQ